MFFIYITEAKTARLYSDVKIHALINSSQNNPKLKPHSTKATGESFKRTKRNSGDEVKYFYFNCVFL